MADKITGIIEPSVLGGQDIYQFTLDGMATSKQMDRLLDLTKDLVKKLVGEGADSLKSLNKNAGVAADQLGDFASAAEEAKEQVRDFKAEQNKASSFLRNVWSRHFTLALDETDKALGGFAFAVGFAHTRLTAYSKDLTEGLKRGVAGNTFDLAIAAKSAGISLTSFNKALTESGGGFASLGINATDGALQFGRLVKSVRNATASVGNLGLTNDEIAMLTAQQTKIAVTQGFKGRQAQEVVIRNTRVLGEELDNLAARTGKSTLELAQAAAKLAQDPLVANFVRSAKEGGEQISAAVQSFAASMRGMFGEPGEALAKDALQSAMSGLPMVITQTGKNLVFATSGIYTELERQAQVARSGGKIAEEDRQRLQQMILKEVKARSQELNQFAMLGGPVGDSAKAMLELAANAEFYNTTQGKEQRRQSDAAKRFNTELNKLQATLQELLIPLLQGLNAIDWATIFKVVSYIPSKIAEVIDFVRDAFSKLPDFAQNIITSLGEVIGKGTGLLIGFVTTLGLVATAYVVYKNTLGAITTLYKGISTDLGSQRAKYNIVGKALDYFAATLNKASVAAGGRGMRTPTTGPADAQTRRRTSTILGPDGKPIVINEPAPQPKPGTAAPPTTGTTVKSKLLKGLGYGSLMGVGAEMLSGAVGTDNVVGKGLDVAGTAASWGALGMAFGPKGAIAGALAGAVYAGFQNFFGDKAGTASEEIKEEKMSAAEKAENDQKVLLDQNRRILEELRRGNEEVSHGNQISSRNVAYAAESSRKLSDLRFNQP